MPLLRTLLAVVAALALAHTASADELYGTLKNAYNAAYVPNEYLYFYLDGNYIGAALTNTSGKATLK